MLTLVLVATLQQAPLDLSAPPPPPQVTRESINKKTPATRGSRILGMTGMWFVASFGTGLVGVIPGIVAGAAGGGFFSAIIGGLVGGAIGMGVGAVFIAPVLMWAFSKSVGGKGSLLATYLGAGLGAAIVTGLFWGWYLSLQGSLLRGSDAPQVLGPILAACSPMLIAGGPWAYEISHSFNDGAEKKQVRVAPTFTPINGGALAGLSGTF